jgi:hypothetical protein
MKSIIRRILNKDGKIIDRRDFRCATDTDAMLKAAELADRTAD